MKTSLVERTPGAGRQANFSSGMTSANTSNWLDTWAPLTVISLPESFRRRLREQGARTKQ